MEDDEEVWVNIAEEDKVQAVTLADIRKALAEEKQLSQLVSDVKKGKLSDNPAEGGGGGV